MDFRLFFKNKFLRTTFGDFANSLNNANYATFKNTLKSNKSWYIPASIFNSEDKTIHKLFDSIDGTQLKNGQNKYGEKNQQLELQELYDWVRFNYKQFKGKELTDDELKNMKMSDFMKNVEEFTSNGFKL